MNDIQQAREWAENGAVKVNSGEVIDEIAKAAVRVIQSLPDQWVDAEKVREEADRMDRGAENSMKPGHNEFSRGYAEAMQECAEHLRNLLTPPLPTLADMTPEERKACQWMQADVSLQGETLRVVITRTVERYSSVEIIDPNGFQVSYDHELVTPLPDLPKLEWPGSTPDDVAYATGGALTTQDVVDECRAVRKERALPRPEDVPAGEPWLVLSEGRRAIGYRNDPGASLPWVITYQGCMEFDYCYDSDITLVSRLVPEVKP